MRQVLTEIELSRRPVPADAEPEHLFLVLDRNVQGFPWESIPALRGRPVSRIPSLPFLLDELDMLKLKAPLSAATPSSEGDALAPALAGLGLNGASTAPNNGRRAVDHRRVFYILNPSEDLSATQTRLEPLMEKNRAAGWKGIVGRKPTVLEMQRALQDYDLVLWVRTVPLFSMHTDWSTGTLATGEESSTFRSTSFERCRSARPRCSGAVLQVFSRIKATWTGRACRTSTCWPGGESL